MYGILALLVLHLAGAAFANEANLEKQTAYLVGKQFKLKAPLVRLTYSADEVHHATHVYGDSTVVYRLSPNSLVEGETKTIAESLNERLAKKTVKGKIKAAEEKAIEIVNDNPQEFIRQVREENAKYKSQILSEGSRVTIERVNFKEKSATVYVKTLSDQESRVYLEFKTKSYTMDDFQRFFGIIFSAPAREK